MLMFMAVSNGQTTH